VRRLTGLKLGMGGLARFGWLPIVTEDLFFPELGSIRTSF